MTVEDYFENDFSRFPRPHIINLLTTCCFILHYSEGTQAIDVKKNSNFSESYSYL